MCPYFSVGEALLSFVLFEERMFSTEASLLREQNDIGPEAKHANIEKVALAIMLKDRRLRPYFLTHRVVVSTNISRK